MPASPFAHLGVSIGWKDTVAVRPSVTPEPRMIGQRTGGRARGQVRVRLRVPTSQRACVRRRPRGKHVLERHTIVCALAPGRLASLISSRGANPRVCAPLPWQQSSAVAGSSRSGRSGSDMRARATMRAQASRTVMTFTSGPGASQSSLRAPASVPKRRGPEGRRCMDRRCRLSPSGRWCG